MLTAYGCFLPVSGYAAALDCTTRVAKTTPSTALAALSKISQPEAQTHALAKMALKHRASSFEIVSSDLEVERGCLVYSFDIRIVGKAGVKEIFVDAGNGKILSYQHETPKQEAAERAKEQLSKSP